MNASGNADKQFKKVGDAAEDTAQQVKKTSSAMDGLGEAFKGLGLLTLSKQISDLGKEMLGLHHIQERAEATLEASTGKMAQQWKDFASEIQKTSIFGDEKVIQDALIPLNNFFRDSPGLVKILTQASADFASAMGKDIGAVAQQFGQYINEGSKGFSRLKRQGVTFTDELQKQVIALEEQGRHEDAKLVMAQAVADAYEGQAEAIANTSFGKWEQFHNLVGDVKEEFGEIIADYLTPILENLRKGVEWIQSWDDETKRLVVQGGGLLLAASTILGIYTTIKGIRTTMMAMRGINMMAGTAMPAGAVVGGKGAGTPIIAPVGQAGKAGSAWARAGSALGRALPIIGLAIQAHEDDMNIIGDALEKGRMKRIGADAYKREQDLLQKLGQLTDTSTYLEKADLFSQLKRYKKTEGYKGATRHTKRAVDTFMDAFTKDVKEGYKPGSHTEWLKGQLGMGGATPIDTGVDDETPEWAKPAGERAGGLINLPTARPAPAIANTNSIVNPLKAILKVNEESKMILSMLYALIEDFSLQGKDVGRDNFQQAGAVEFAQ